MCEGHVIIEGWDRIRRIIQCAKWQLIPVTEFLEVKANRTIPVMTEKEFEKSGWEEVDVLPMYDIGYTHDNVWICPECK